MNLIENYLSVADGISTAFCDAATTEPFASFIESVRNGQARTVVGIYIPGVIAFPVSQQPPDDASYVTRQMNQVTQFAPASQYGTVGLLAHNDLAGATFSDFHLMDYAIVVFGDGRLAGYVIDEFQRYQALSPTSAFSDFICLDGSGERLTAHQVFNRVYAPGRRLVFQTCINAFGEASWGRLFVIAKPIRRGPVSSPDSIISPMASSGQMLP